MSIRLATFNAENLLAIYGDSGRDISPYFFQFLLGLLNDPLDDLLARGHIMNASYRLSGK